MSNIREPKRDIYQEVTDRIVAELEAGRVPWRRPWASPDGMHNNPVSGTTYHGINPFLLDLTAQAAGYDDPRWITFRQAIARKGAVRKGEKSTLVVFWKLLRVKDDDGEPKTLPLLRHYNVFNVAQVDGIEWPALAERPAFDPIAAAEAIVTGYPNAPTLRHGGDSACYAPAWDQVMLPAPELFTTREAYYSTAFHELIHSTGHGSRLARPEVGSSRFGSEPYAREELVAELGASMLCAHAGIEPDWPQSATYVAGWLSALRNDRKLIVAAGGRASRAAEHVRGVVAQVETPAEPAMAAAA